jgi:histidine ammonia-lyase
VSSTPSGALHADAPIEIGGRRLSIEDVVQVARQAQPLALLDADARARVEATAAWVAETIDGIEAAHGAGVPPRAYYGVNTGFGALAGKSALDSRYLAELLGRNLIASHTVGVGPCFDEEVVRAVLMIRAQSLAQGYSGVRPVVIETLIRMLNAGVYPAVPEQGSLGASGDLAPLAHLALAMTGPPSPSDGDADVGLDHTDREALVPSATGRADEPLHLTEDYATGAQKLWRRVSGAEAMSAVGGKLELRPKEALALLNGATVSAAIAALVVADAQNLLDHAELALAMTLEGGRGFRDPFLPQLHAARGHANAGAIAARVLAYVEGSELLDPGNLSVDPARVPPQDPYCVRCGPQVLGAAADTLELARRWVEMDVNAATDNPLIFLDLERDYKVVSGGNFHGEPIALAMDFLSIAMTELASLSDRRMFMLNDYRPGKPDGLPSFLVDEPVRTAGLNAGLMMLQATAAALVSDCKVLAHPDSVDSIPSSGNQEDHVSMSLNAARHARQIARNVEHVLAMELICAAQAIWLQKAKPGAGDLRLGRGVGAAYAAIRKAGIDPLTRDRVLQPDIRRAVRLLRSRTLIEAARA